MAENHSKDPLKPVNHSFLREDVYKSIKEAIIQGGFESGERLSEASLAKRLGTSRTPVREALHRLESEGLVETLPRRGSFVRDIPVDQIDELYSVRGLLEGFASRKAVANASESDIQELVDLIDEYEKKLDHGPKQELTDLHERFHRKILSFCGPIINNVMKDLRGYTARLQFLAMSQTSRPRQVLLEHRDLVEAIKSRNADEADRITQEHMQSGLSSAIENLGLSKRD